MTINFNHFFASHAVLDALQAKKAALMAGTVIEHNDKRYYFQILPTTTEDGLKTRLIFQAYTETGHEIRYYDQGSSRAAFIAGSGFGNGAIPMGTRFFEVIIQGNIVEEAEEIIFQGNLKGAETAFYEANEELAKPRVPEVEEEAVDEIPPPVTTTGWTRPQKASLLVVTVLATMTIAYGAKKVVNHYDLKAPKMPTLEDLKASLEKLRNWRKGAAAA